MGDNKDLLRKVEKVVSGLDRELTPEQEKKFIGSLVEKGSMKVEFKKISMKSDEPDGGKYRPELGQSVLGTPWDPHCGKWSSDGLSRISVAARGCESYGVEFDCDVFEMHTYWWGDEDVPEWERPNFLHKKTGLRVRWYKHMFRGVSSDRDKPDNWEEIVEECIEAARNHTGGTK